MLMQDPATDLCKVQDERGEGGRDLADMGHESERVGVGDG